MHRQLFLAYQVSYGGLHSAFQHLSGHVDVVQYFTRIILLGLTLFVAPTYIYVLTMK